MSGGFDVGDADITDGPLVSASHRRGKRSWLTKVILANESATITTHAYCEKT